MPANSRKNRASSELLYESNRPQVSMVHRHDKLLGMLEEHSRIRKSLPWFTNSSRVLPTSRVVYQPINHAYKTMVYCLKSSTSFSIRSLNCSVTRTPAQVCQKRHLFAGCFLVKCANIRNLGGAVVSWLVRWSPDRAVRARTLAGDIVLCSWARHYSHSASLHPGV